MKYADNFRERRFAFFLILKMLLAGVAITTIRTRSVSADTCGVSAVYAAAVALGKAPQFEGLYDEKYISSHLGSTLPDLIEAVHSLRLHSTPYKNLSLSSLLEAKDPLILHVASFGQLHRYNHWILFLGVRGNNAVVSDSASEPYEVPLAELMATWDGIALAIHANENPLSDFRQVESRTWLFWSSCFLFLVALFWSFNRRFSGLRWPIIFTALSCWILLTFAVNGWGAGLLSSPKTATYVLATLKRFNFQRIDFEELFELIERQRNSQDGILTLIDARFAEDTSIGEIPSSINVPVNSSSQQIELKLSGIDRRVPVVIYCLSESCTFSEFIGVRMAGKGFTDIRIFKPGWYGWVEAMEHVAASLRDAE